MTDVATWTAQEYPLQVRAVTYYVPAGVSAVLSHVAPVQHKVAVPLNRVKRCRPADVATGAGRAGPADAVEVGPVAERVGAAGCSVYRDIASVQGIGKMPPLEGMDRFLIAEVTLGAGYLRNAPCEI